MLFHDGMTRVLKVLKKLFFKNKCAKTKLHGVFLACLPPDLCADYLPSGFTDVLFETCYHPKRFSYQHYTPPPETTLRRGKDGEHKKGTKRHETEGIYFLIAPKTIENYILTFLFWAGEVSGEPCWSG